MDCIFCKIANGEIPSASIYEDEDFNVILDLGPAKKGHALILTKKHYADLFELPEEEAKKAIVLAKKLLPAIKKGLNCDGIQLVQNNGAAAGQTLELIKIIRYPCVHRYLSRCLFCVMAPSAAGNLWQGY